jgi:predicted lysophospholipase L1 biosynthesis ABC-type transport system permease subunit
MSGRQARTDARGARRREHEQRDDRDEWDDLEDRRNGRRISPGVVFLAIAIVGSIAYMAFVFTVRENSQIPLMASGLVVLAIVFVALAVYCLREALRAGLEDRGRWALGVAIVGGGAAIAAAVAVAGALILFQLASPPA